jgi:hypothetical protein
VSRLRSADADHASDGHDPVLRTHQQESFLSAEFRVPKCVVNGHQSHVAGTVQIIELVSDIAEVVISGESHLFSVGTTALSQ